MNNYTILSVTAIKQGCVIDHITAGQGIKILQALDLLKLKYQITVGLNLPSKRKVLKDLIKITNFYILNATISKIGIIAPGSTINEIKNYKVKKKYMLKLPNIVKGLFICPNTQCITQTESLESYFYVLFKKKEKDVKLICRYCETFFDKNILENIHY